MATLALAAVGAAIGGSIGGTILGISAATIGMAIGSAVGGVLDQHLFGSGTRHVGGGPRLGDLSIQVSTYGKALPVVYAGRIAGNLIWASDKREVHSVNTVSGGKGGSPDISTDSYDYYVDMAVSLGEGPIAGVRKAWADGTLIWDVDVDGDDPEGITVQHGTDTQGPAPLMETHEGAGQVPGYRNQAYVLFENFHLNPYGGRIPSFSFEVVGLPTCAWGEDHAQGMAQGLDGDLWLVGNLQRTVTRLDPVSLRPKAVVGREDDESYLGTLPAQPWRICCEPTTGHLFVTALCDARVLRVDPATNAVVAVIAVEAYPHEILADGLGGVWVSHPLTDRLSRVDAASGAVEEVVVAGQPFAMCRDADARLWIGCLHEIVHFDPASRTELRRVDLGEKWFPGGLAYNAGDKKVWFACSGNDVVGVVNRSTYALSWRNSGTWPAYAACHPDDPAHTVWVSLVYGNRLKMLRRAEDNGLDEFMEYKTEVWPGPLLALADGRCLVSNTNRPFAQEFEGPRA